MMPRYLSDGSEDSMDERDESEIVYVPFRGNSYEMCTDRYAPRRNIVLLYARLGLHRYNFLQGKNLQLSRVGKYIQSWGSAASGYSITLKAKDPETNGSLQTFKTHVAEHNFGKFRLRCTMAYPLGDTKEMKRITGHGKSFRHICLQDFMPELPSENPFKNTDRFYVLKKSEIRHNDWIRLYVELAVATTNRHHIKHGVNNLKILKAAMEITRNLEPFNKGLGAFDAVFYIRYKDSCKARAGEDVDRVAIVRRIWDEQEEILRLVGRTESSKTIKPSNGSAAVEAASSSTQD